MLKLGPNCAYSKEGTDKISAVAFSFDGKRMAASSDNQVKIWEVSTGRELLYLSGHSDGVNDVTFSPDGRLIATAADDGTAKVWLASTGQELFSLQSDNARVTSVSFSPDCSRLVATNGDGSARVYTLNTSELINLAQQRVSRHEFTADERKRYLHEFEKR